MDAQKAERGAGEWRLLGEAPVVTSRGRDVLLCLVTAVTWAGQGAAGWTSRPPRLHILPTPGLFQGWRLILLLNGNKCFLLRQGSQARLWSTQTDTLPGLRETEVEAGPARQTLQHGTWPSKRSHGWNSHFLGSGASVLRGHRSPQCPVNLFFPLGRVFPHPA